MKNFVVNSLKSTYQDKNILLGVTGSIAAYKVCELVRLFKEAGANVKIMMTKASQKFVTPTTLQTLSEEKVYDSLWSGQGDHQHIDLARWADVVLVVPASANTISKITHGIGEDLLTTEVLAFNGPLYLAPAMNPQMYKNSAIQENLSVLKKRGVKLIGPDYGVTSCGEEGLGRMVEPLEIFERLSTEFFAPSKKSKVLINLGPTRSYLDPVRYLTNRSSGKMGASLAWAALGQGYDVTVIAGPTNVALPKSAKIIRVTTSKQMEKAVLKNFDESDIFISTAAVLDFEFQDKNHQKLKKDSGMPEMNLVKTNDILKKVCEIKREDQFVLGFSAETENPVMYAKKKLFTKKCDAVFANKVSESSPGGFESDENYGWWISKQVEEFSLQSKIELSRKIIRNIEREIEERNRSKIVHPLEKIGLRIYKEDKEDQEIAGSSKSL